MAELGSGDCNVPALVGRVLTFEAFSALSGYLGGHAFVKVVVDRRAMGGVQVHFLNHRRYQFHVDYIAECILGKSAGALDEELDSFNADVYHNPDRRFMLGTLVLHKRDEHFFSLETVEVDTMSQEMVVEFYQAVRAMVDARFELYFKPANHQQEAMVEYLKEKQLPVVSSHELVSSSQFVALHPGSAEGRLRIFRDLDDYEQNRSTLEWYDIIVMDKVPDDIPRLSGIINSSHTTPLSHTNVLASNWQIPNAVQVGAVKRLLEDGWNGEWVRYVVERDASEIGLTRIEKPQLQKRPAWAVHVIRLEEPEIGDTPILPLQRLRIGDRYRYGTKAANLGELYHLLEHGSERLLGYYRLPRPPRKNLLPYLARFLGVPETSEVESLTKAAVEFLRDLVKVPRGIAIPFSFQREFLESSPAIQQTIGKIKMALELEARVVDSLCLRVQNLIRRTRMSDAMRATIDREIAEHLLGVSKFVVRSSSNAEDLEDFSAAGIYESITHVSTAENIFRSIKEVWASLLSPRSTRLRHEVGISLDDCYMGVIVQEEVPARIGGVLVTVNPTNADDFRNVYINVSPHSVGDVVDGVELPLQYLYNTVEGGGRTLTLGSAREDVAPEDKELMQKLAFAGRLLQAHYSPDYTFAWPLDVEWLANDEGLYILQLRPYSK